MQKICSRGNHVHTHKPIVFTSSYQHLHTCKKYAHMQNMFTHKQTVFKLSYQYLHARKNMLTRKLCSHTHTHTNKLWSHPVINICTHVKNMLTRKLCPHTQKQIVLTPSYQYVHTHTQNMLTRKLCSHPELSIWAHKQNMFTLNYYTKKYFCQKIVNPKHQ